MPSRTGRYGDDHERHDAAGAGLDDVDEDQTQGGREQGDGVHQLTHVEPRHTPQQQICGLGDRQAR